MAPTTTNPDWLQELVRANVRLLKALRDMSDQDISEKAGFTSRQVISHRLSGRTEFSTGDFARLAAALRVEPHVLLMDTDEVFKWTTANGDYKPPRYRKQRPMPQKGNRG